VTSSGFKPETS